PRVWLPTTVLVVILGVAWSVIADAHPYILPRLAEVRWTLLDEPLLFLENTLSTLQIALTGVAFGADSASRLAVLMSAIPMVRRARIPPAASLNVTSVIAITPTMVEAVAFGMTPKVVVTAIITFSPVSANGTSGLLSITTPILHAFETL